MNFEPATIVRFRTTSKLNFRPLLRIEISRLSGWEPEGRTAGGVRKNPG